MQRTAARLVVTALVVLGLVGMHHLVVAACHLAAGHGDHSPVLSMDSVVAHGSHDDAQTSIREAAPAEVPSDRSDGMPGGIVGAAATCLAILLMVVGVVLPKILARSRRWQSLQLTAGVPVKAAPASKPPDLTLLSVSRT